MAKAPKRNQHHLFTKDEIKAKLIEIFGEPKNEKEAQQLKQEVRYLWNRMPRYRITVDLHNSIHSRFAVVPAFQECYAAMPFIRVKSEHR